MEALQADESEANAAAMTSYNAEPDTTIDLRQIG